MDLHPSLASDVHHCAMASSLRSSQVTGLALLVPQAGYPNALKPLTNCLACSHLHVTFMSPPPPSHRRSLFLAAPGPSSSVKRSHQQELAQRQVSEWLSLPHVQRLCAREFGFLKQAIHDL